MMKCPVDGNLLLMTERNGVEIDYCPQCRGIWLDRGELEKLIERSERAPSRPFVSDNYDEGYPREGGEYPGKKRKSFLGEMFDIFD
jgi:Zn-finger nucleic acid-binding protein